ncbi:hypothetical protein OG762_21955 [Streptomyces sp. NBC_01136]|uniref:hypothetical protein n=1 Tax=unclassified Streptomyces TaxID=2593676 RepID=UPI0032485D64|nr:hypothetical protein OG762_21955 [Streptomyces sp. NBC_01136]
MHPTFLTLTDDTTRVISEALHNLNVRHLRELTTLLRHYAGAAAPPRPEVPQVPTPPITETGPDVPVIGFHVASPDHPGEGDMAISRMPLVDEPDDSGIDIPGFHDPHRRGPRRFSF